MYVCTYLITIVYDGVQNLWKMKMRSPSREVTFTVIGININITTY